MSGLCGRCVGMDASTAQMMGLKCMELTCLAASHRASKWQSNDVGRGLSASTVFFTASC